MATTTITTLKREQSSKLAKILTKELRSILKELGHYDTGTLDRSINFGITLSKTTGSLRVNFYGEFYFKYLRDMDIIINKLENSNGYKQVMDLYMKFMEENIADDIFLTFKQLKKNK